MASKYLQVTRTDPNSLFYSFEIGENSRCPPWSRPAYYGWVGCLNPCRSTAASPYNPYEAVGELPSTVKVLRKVAGQLFLPHPVSPIMKKFRSANFVASPISKQLGTT